MINLLKIAKIKAYQILSAGEAISAKNPCLNSKQLSKLSTI